MKVRVVSDWFGFTLESESGVTEFIQTDNDFPGLAGLYGWQPCHRSTDGTTNCPECGQQSTKLIQSASDCLDEHAGEWVDDTVGYF